MGSTTLHVWGIGGWTKFFCLHSHLHWIGQAIHIKWPARTVDAVSCRVQAKKLPRRTPSHRYWVLFRWRTLPRHAITMWRMSGGKNNTRNPVTGKQWLQKSHNQAWKDFWRNTPNQKKIHTFSSPHRERVSSYSACRGCKGFCKPDSPHKKNIVLFLPLFFIIFILFQQLVLLTCTHLPPCCHSFGFFAVNVSFNAGLSLRYENAVPKSQGANCHSNGTERCSSLHLFDKQTQHWTVMILH